MRVPSRLEPLVDQGVIDEVLRPLMSGKEAEVFLVLAGGEQRVAKIYKEAENRSFKQRAEYTEGRRTRNSRGERAMASRSAFGREQEEEAWRTAEVDAIYRLREAGVRVPEPYDFVDGVLVMELISTEDGEPAPRLVDMTFTPAEAKAVFNTLLREVVKMLCAGLVHGDLSDFNVLIGPEGPVIIDFPQAVDPARNNNARKLLVRDVRNLQSFLARYAPDLKQMKYGEEMWALYENNALMPDTVLTGRFKGSDRKADTRSVLDEIADSIREERARREALGLPPPRVARTPRFTVEEPIAKGKGGGDRGDRGGRPNDGDRGPRGGDRPSGGDRGGRPGDRSAGGDRGPRGGDRPNGNDRGEPRFNQGDRGPRPSERGGDRGGPGRGNNGLDGGDRGDRGFSARPNRADRPPAHDPPAKHANFDDLDALLAIDDD